MQEEGTGDCTIYPRKSIDMKRMWVEVGEVRRYSRCYWCPMLSLWPDSTIGVAAAQFLP